MRNSPYNPSQWSELIPRIDALIAEIERVPIISIGITPYTRVIPALFLKNYSVYVTRRSSDVDVMEHLVRMHVLEDRDPKLAARVHGTGYLLGSYAFRNFLKSRRGPVRLMINTAPEKSIAELRELGYECIGNLPAAAQGVAYKGDFRRLVRERELPSVPSKEYTRADFLSLSFDTLWNENEGSFVVQRADKEVGGNEGTFFVHTKEQFNRSVEALERDDSFSSVLVTPYIDGPSVSMLGCVMAEGILSGPLQLQLIDVPESLHGVGGDGMFFGNDLGFAPWGADIEQQAQQIVESIGAHMREQGYRGIFGIDFLYDEKRGKIYPNECNPRFTGSVTLYSLMLLESRVPPLEFFHLLAHLGIPADFDFNTVNAALKKRIPCSHVAFSPKGILSMEMPLLAGVYSYDASGPSLAYKGPGISLADIKNENEFLIIDTVPKMGAAIEQSAVRLFKFIFPRSIALSSYKIDATAGFLLERFSRALISASEKATPKSD